MTRPLPVILDEAANICRIADLPDFYSHLGSRGIVPVTILQSYEQGITVWGEPAMAALWGAAAKKLVTAKIRISRPPNYAERRPQVVEHCHGIGAVQAELALAGEEVGQLLGTAERLARNEQAQGDVFSVTASAEGECTFARNSHRSPLLCDPADLTKDCS